VELPRPAADVIRRCQEAGVLVISAGPSNVRLAPPLIISPPLIDEGLAVLEAAIAADLA
jgi:acetylornithine/succinyldiaminopimelate/putrescine aminotransferase